MARTRTSTKNTGFVATGPAVEKETGQSRKRGSRGKGDDKPAKRAKNTRTTTDSDPKESGQAQKSKKKTEKKDKKEKKEKPKKESGTKGDEHRVVTAFSVQERVTTVAPLRQPRVRGEGFFPEHRVVTAYHVTREGQEAEETEFDVTKEEIKKLRQSANLADRVTSDLLEEEVQYAEKDAQSAEAVTISTQRSPHRLRRPRTTWKIDGPPITNPEDVPEDWDINESDLDEFAMIASEPDLSGDTLVRVDTLKKIEACLLKDSDPDNQLLNVRAIIKAYRQKEITFNPPYVTYWVRGKLYKGPEVFELQNPAQYQRELKQARPFWVEGWDGPAPSSLNFVGTIPPISANTFTHTIRLAMRPPHIPDYKSDEVGDLSTDRGQVEFDFLDDTGCKHMLIFDRDRWEIEEKYNCECPDMGTTYVSTAAGVAALKAIHVDVSLFWDEGYAKHQILPWSTVTCYVVSGSVAPTQPRLSGVWLRHLLYTMTRPDKEGSLFLSDEFFHDGHKLDSSTMLKRRTPLPVSFRTPQSDVADKKYDDELRRKIRQRIWDREDYEAQEAADAKRSWWFRWNKRRTGEYRPPPSESNASSYAELILPLLRMPHGVEVQDQIGFGNMAPGEIMKGKNAGARRVKPPPSESFASEDFDGVDYEDEYEDDPELDDREDDEKEEPGFFSKLIGMVF
ncbi:hypothetical protein N7478_011706 [Penicillium angulare]|uniref:uncharacterized protein n=1 Tax=Penicillium angulare TaxID=116970 RepID=UPI00254075D2|nr:uncharacterized protein N7478_011706 [Penicillium angulare]KAJ5261111.1 hypothetical protein N7478_011706 [Penicillium angulare]